MKKKVIFYFDGLNIYYGFRDINREYLNWLNVVKFCENNLPIIDENCELLMAKYYTANLLKKGEKNAQLSFLRANEEINKSNKKFKVIKGLHTLGSSWCDHCEKVTIKMREKKTDVHIALDMVKDSVIDGIADVSVLMTNDVDIVPSINMIRQLKADHRVILLVPPTKKKNFDLQVAVMDKHALEPQNNVIQFPANEEESRYLACQLNEEIRIHESYTIIRPKQYNRQWLDKKKTAEWFKKNEIKKPAKSAPDNSDVTLLAKLDDLKKIFNK